MKGDFSQIRLSRGKGYTAVLQQQGRVALDADANEQQFLDERHSCTELVDVIGQFGGPDGDEGFAIDASGADIVIGAGHYYVNGLLCENPEPLSYDNQSYLNVPAGTGASLLTGLFEQPLMLQVYLQAWQRLVTALDDPCLREPALGQADTTVRLQTVWRVIARTVQVDLAQVKGPFCPTLYQAAPPAASTGTLTVTTSGAAADCGCGPVAAAGYQGIENQLYRVEIQDGGDAGDATFKWSRENGSVVCAVTDVTSAATVQVDSLGPDANLGFQPTQWVELTDDTYLFGDPPNEPGTLYQIQSVDKDNLTATFTAPVTGIDTTRNARMRRWDQAGPAASSMGISLPVTPAVMELENGIQVSFGAGTYQPGDYWTFPARTATSTVEWPPCDSDGNPAQPPASIVVHEAPLACLYWVGGRRSGQDPLPLAGEAAVEGRLVPSARAADTTATASQSHVVQLGHVVMEDCRRSFSALTDLTPTSPPQAIHVQAISWFNDDVMTLDELIANGLTVTLDQTATGPVNGGNFIVSLELVWGPGQDVVGIATPAAFGELAPTAIAEDANSTLIRTAVILDPQVTVANQSIAWLPALGTWAGYVQQVLSRPALSGQFARVRVRLLGEMLFANGASGPIYLDGKAFGQPGIRADRVTPRVDLKFPSGDGSASSDLESWFYLAPILGLTQPSVAYPSLTGVVDVFGRFLGVEPTPTDPTAGPAARVSQTVTIDLNYPPITLVIVNLVLTSNSDDLGTVASIPASVSIAAGQASCQVPVTISAAPQQTIDFTVTATLSTAISSLTNQQSVQFTIVGPPVQLPIVT